MLLNFEKEFYSSHNLNETQLKFNLLYYLFASFIYPLKNIQLDVWSFYKILTNNLLIVSYEVLFQSILYSDLLHHN